MSDPMPAESPRLIFSLQRLQRNIRSFRELCDAAFGSQSHELFFPSKVASWNQLLRPLVDAGLGLEAIHPGSAKEALAMAPGKVILGGPAKTRAVIDLGLRPLGWRFVSCESLEEVELVHRLAREAGIRQEVLLRLKVTPLRRLGMSLEDAEEVLSRQDRLSALLIVGLHVHPGSNLTFDETELTAGFVLNAAARLARAGLCLAHINFGGGFPCLDPDADEVARRLERYAQVARHFGVRAVLEPGRVLVGDAARLMARVTEVRDRDRQMTIDCAAYVIHGPCNADKHIVHIRRGECEGEHLKVVRAKAGCFRIGGIWPAEGDSIWLDRRPTNCQPGDGIVFPHAGAYSLGFLEELSFEGLKPTLHEDWSDA